MQSLSSNRVSVSASGWDETVGSVLRWAVRTARNTASVPPSISGLRYPNNPNRATPVLTSGAGYGSARGKIVIDFGASAGEANKFAALVRAERRSHPRRQAAVQVKVL